MKKVMFMKILIAIMAMSIAVVMFAACSDDDSGVAPDPDVIYADSIVLSQKTLYLSVGKTANLEASIYPENVTDSTIVWTSEDDGIATVENGVVTAVSDGEVIITAIANGGAEGTTVFATCEVVVATPSVGDFFYADGTFSKTLDNTKNAIGIVFYVGDVVGDNPSLQEIFPNGTTGLVLSIDNPQHGEFIEEWGEYGGVEWSGMLFAGYAMNNGIEAENILLDWIEENCSDADVTNQTALNGYENTLAYFEWNSHAENDGITIEEWDYELGDFTQIPVVLTVLDDLQAYRESGSVIEDGVTVTPWYIPSIAEWEEIAEHVDLINEKLESFGFENQIDLQYGYDNLQIYWSSTQSTEKGFENDCVRAYSFAIDENSTERGSLSFGWMPCSIKYVFAF